MDVKTKSSISDFPRVFESIRWRLLPGALQPPENVNSTRCKVTDGTEVHEELCQTLKRIAERIAFRSEGMGAVHDKIRARKTDEGANLPSRVGRRARQRLYAS
jgi:hypothetical protein